MKPTPDSLAAAADLKSCAEAARQAKAEVLPESLATLASDATQNELREKQIELQNEELRRAQHELATSRARYFDLYDLAPVGYLVVRESGLILQANLTAAAMLGEDRGALTNRPVSRTIFNADQEAYYLCRKRLVDTGEPQSCELRVVKPDGHHLWVLVAMSAACADDGTPLHRVTLTDIGESKRAEAALWESEERLRVALTAAAAIGFVWDAASDAVVRYFSTVPSLPVNVDAPEPVAAVRARVHPDDVGLFDAGVAECLVMGTEYRNLYRVVDPAGSERWLREWGTLSRDSAGHPLRLTGISIDVTDLKRAESNLLLADCVLKNVSQGVIVTGPDQMIVTANTAFTAITGYSEQEIMGRNCNFLQGPGTDPVTVAAIRQVLEDGNDFAGEILNYRKDGTPFWNELTITPVLDPQGVLTHFILITRDINERKRAEDELRHISERFELVARGAVDGIWDWDVVTNAYYFSGRWCELLGYTTAELLPHYQTWVDHLHPEDRPGTFAALQSHLEQRAPYDLEYRMRLKCGEYRWFRASGQAMWDADGKPLRMAGSITDITERKQAEQSLKLAHTAADVASRAKSEFLTNMSHEIRTPLTAILGFADILDEDGTVDQTPDNRKQILDTIKKAGAHLLTVINDILDLSKIEADKLAVEKIDTPLVNVLCEVEMLMRQKVAGKGLVLSIAFSSPVPDRILSDPTRLRQILMNILGNAIKFTEEGTVRVNVEVEAQDRQPRLVIDIADTGPGMTSEQVQRLFAAFGQADTTVTRKYGGTGLGLVISRRLARIMGGDVTLLYSELGKGSCFRIVLPIEYVEGSTMMQSPTPIKSTDEAKPIAAALNLSGRILLAEDGLDNQRLIAFMLRKAGATVETADDGQIALHILKQAEAAGKPFDLLLTDMQMPEMDGYCLASTLRDRGSKLAIIALTAHAMADDRKKCMDAGCDDYVSKPIDKATLIATCAAWMSKPGGIQ